MNNYKSSSSALPNKQKKPQQENSQGPSPQNRWLRRGLLPTCVCIYQHVVCTGGPRSRVVRLAIRHLDDGGTGRRIRQQLRSERPRLRLALGWRCAARWPPRPRHGEQARRETTQPDVRAPTSGLGRMPWDLTSSGVGNICSTGRCAVCSEPPPSGTGLSW